MHKLPGSHTGTAIASAFDSMYWKMQILRKKKFKHDIAPKKVCGLS